MSGPDPAHLELGLHHEFLLLALEDVRGTRLLGHYEDKYGLAGALVAEMQLRDRLAPVAADVFALRQGPLSSGALGLAEQRLEGKQLSLKRTLRRVANVWLSDISAIRTAALEELVRAGVLTREADRFLIVTWRMRYPEVDSAVEGALRSRLRRHVQTVDDGDAPMRDDLLLSLLRGTKLLRTVWSEGELATVKPAIDARTRRAPIGRTVRRVAEDARAAAAAAAASFGCPALEDDPEAG